jgi:hypothetical protein
VSDAVSLAEFASILGVSEPTVRKRLGDAAEGVVLSRGKNGEAYQIDARAGVAWWQTLAADAEAERQARIAKVQSLQLELLGDDTALGSHELEGLTPAEQAAQLDAELKAIRLGRERGELVRAADVEAALGAFMLKLHEQYSGLTDRLRRRAEIPEEVAATLDRLVQRDLNDLADAAARIGERQGETEEGAAASRIV